MSANPASRLNEPSQRTRAIVLRGVRVHNLKDLDLDLPLGQLVVMTGVSGSGKSSLAFDTLYAEGQRRYIESFSAYARQFLDRLEKPDADRIEHIPPAIAVRQQPGRVSGRSTVATATEIHDYLRLIYAKIGRILCANCGLPVVRDTPKAVLDRIRSFTAGTRFQIVFPVALADSDEHPAQITALVRDGFHRAVVGNRTVSLSENESPARHPLWVIVDRLTAGTSDADRIAESIELAFRQGEGRCLVLEETIGEPDSSADSARIDERPYHIHRFSERLACEQCGREYLEPEPRLFSFNSAWGACPTCEGFGSVPATSFAKLVPDPDKSLREGAIAPWTTPAYRHELDELLALAADYDIPVDVPFRELTPAQLDLIRRGVPERRFGGLEGFFRWLERHKYQLSVRVFLNRWRAYEPCPYCHGDRLRPEALAVRIGDRHIAEFARLTVSETILFLNDVAAGLSEHQAELIRTPLREITARLEYLVQVGLGYLTLDRPLRTLSGGESRRVSLTAALGSNLVNTLYVLDEPSAGLHPRDSARVIQVIRRLQQARNSVVVVEHESEFIQAADQVIDIGPGAGEQGGRLIFQGTPAELAACEASITGAYLSGRRRVAASVPTPRRQPTGWLRLEGARLHNLKNVTVAFPLGVLCVVTGVSGSGKSSLVQETLYPAVCQALRQSCDVDELGDFDRLTGAEQIDEVMLVDQTALRRSPRSVPITYMNGFDEIRRVFADTPEAKLRNLTATQFSFNAAGGGRCPRCEGLGQIEIDMQFLADLTMTCPECHGTRFRREILDVKYRGRSIDEVLAMTADEAFTFFRTQRKLQKQLQLLREVGLGYLPLGQPATTLSGGEAQRLKLAAHLASGSQRRTLFILEEPTTGLHPADVVKLLDISAQLLAVGHSLIVTEHNLDLIRAADYLIDLGPDAGEQGGRVVVVGTVEQIAASADSITGRFLRAD